MKIVQKFKTTYENVVLNLIFETEYNVILSDYCHKKIVNEYICSPELIWKDYILPSV